MHGTLVENHGAFVGAYFAASHVHGAAVVVVNRIAAAGYYAAVHANGAAAHVINRICETIITRS